MIGESLKQWREGKGLSQTKAGELLRISREYVGRIEAGKNPSKALQVQIERLIKQEDREEIANLDHIPHVSDSVRSVPQICFQALGTDLAEADDEWLIKQVDYFYSDIMNAADCRTRFTHIGTLANLFKEMQDRLILEWKQGREHFPRAVDVLNKFEGGE